MTNTQDDNIRLAAISAFGLEAVVKRELKSLGYDNVTTDNGWMYFDGSIMDIPRTNINLRCADRVMLIMGQFQALSFEELFNQTYSLPWEKWITKDGKFTVKGKSVKSKLFSVPDCQSIVKKAISKKLCDEYQLEWIKETGAEFTVMISIHEDLATVSIDTTGAREGLFKRGYRQRATDAPMKETMAAALIMLSYWNKSRVLWDPMCGSGTIPIEAALIGRNIAPGLNRTFASKKWPAVGDKYWKDSRAEALRKIDLDTPINIYASDISAEAVNIARHNAEEAGVDDCIHFSVRDVLRLDSLPCKFGVLITNPPYGDRIGDDLDIREVHRSLGKVFGSDETWSDYIITSSDSFEREFGRKADRRRKLFNGDIKVEYYQYFGTRPENQ